jgi:hypothetical protein
MPFLDVLHAYFRGERTEALEVLATERGIELGAE